MANLETFLSSTTVPLLHQLRIRNGVYSFTLTEAATLTARSPNFLSIDVGGATKVVTLPAEADSPGLFFMIYNASGAGEDITLNNDAAVLVTTINEGETAVVACDGTTWHKLLLTTVELSTIRADTINEATSGSGVTVDGVLLKDGGAVFADGATIEVDTVNEATAAAGVTVDGVLLKDGGAVFADAATIEIDTINEATAAAGVTADGVLLKDGGATVTGTLNLSDGSLVERPGAGTGTGDVVEHWGAAAEGMNIVVYEATISPAAVETAILTVPAGSIVDGVWANAEAALTGGGTTATWSIGITGDVDQFGTSTNDDYTTQADSLAQNTKWSYLAGVTPLSNAGAKIGLFDAAAVSMKLIAAAAGGAAAGDTALTVGSVRVRVQYRTILPLADVV